HAFGPPEGRRLQWAIKVREARGGGPGVTGEVLVIQPSGDWQVLSLADQAEPRPLRQGKLGAARLAALAQHLATQDFWDLADESGALPPAGIGDALGIAYGNRHVQVEGVRRRTLWDRGPLEPWQEPLHVRVAALVLVIDD